MAEIETHIRAADTELGLVEAAPAAQDRRVKQLRLSREGAKLEARLTRTQMRQMEKVFAEAGRDAEEGWRRVMRKIPAR